MRKATDTDADRLDLWNAEDASDLERSENSADYDVVVAARDWTVETIVQQVREGNVDLDPSFQRRNAWRDPRRSRLVESFILGFPVPQIVLAENPRKKKTFIVIDGKQRLMTIAGLYLSEFRPYWTHPRFMGLSILTELNLVKLDNFLTQSQYSAERRQLANADIRTTLLTGFKDEGVLYDIFYRINTGSVPLSSQELRQVLNRGDFSKYLLDITAAPNPLQKVLRIDAPDARLRDVELLLRLVALRRFSTDYVGNMKPFLDGAMKRLNSTWDSARSSIEQLVSDIFHGVETAVSIFGETTGRKLKREEFEYSLNRALFEVQVYYFSMQNIRDAARANKKAVAAGFKSLSADVEFTNSIEVTTKSIDNYRTRFEKYRRMLEDALGVRIKPLALGRGARLG